MSYDEELDRLGDAYAAGRDGAPLLAEALESMAGKPSVFVGSGGMLAVARFAADVQSSHTGLVALGVTPLALVANPLLSGGAVAVFSARAVHPDVGLALELARRAGASPRILITSRRPDEIPHLAALATQIVSLPLGGGREGFLATRSVLGFATALAASRDSGLPAIVPARAEATTPMLRRRTLVLHGWRQEPVAIDLETRLSELGLSAVQIVDYRNFAHGRHYGFVKAMAETTVVAVSDMADRELARSTLSVLPDGANVVELSSGLTWPLSTVDLLVGSMHLVGDLATGAAIDPANPRVPSFGRRLYHLSVKKQLPDESIGAVDRKLAAAGVTGSAIWRERYAAALGDWLDRIGARRFKALVLDYDGTMCDTNARTSPIPAEVCAAVAEVLSGGLLVGVASGRGRSLLQSLRSWIPQDYWAQVYVGLYNGGVVGRLDEEIAFPASADPNLAELAARLQDDPLGQPLECELRPTQLSVGASGMVGEGRAVEVMVRDAAARTPALPVRIVRSGHSVDVISEGVSKQVVLSLLADLTKGPVLAIGDQGQAGGNDHALLAADESSLSVDRCSADPTRCWNLLKPGEVGPAGLLRYLRGLHVSHGRARFSWKRNA